MRAIKVFNFAEFELNLISRLWLVTTLLDSEALSDGLSAGESRRRVLVTGLDEQTAVPGSRSKH